MRYFMYAIHFFFNFSKFPPIYCVSSDVLDVSKHALRTKEAISQQYA